MKIIIKIGFIGLLCHFGTGILNAQFEFTGEFRPRTEYSHGYSQLAGPGQDASLFTSQRTRLNFDYKSDKLQTRLVLQDVRIWGSQPQLVSNQDFATSIHEAWFEYKFLESLSLRAGRQELAYDDHRIFGNVGWAQQSRSHDLFLLKFEKGLKIHAGLAYNENTNRTNNFYEGPDAYKTMQFTWINQTINNFSFSLLFLNNGIAYTKDTIATGGLAEQGISYSQTFGPVISYKPGKLQLKTSFFLQTGKDGSQKDLNAYYANLEVSYKISEKLSSGIGYEILSGTPFDETGQNNSFTPLYGTNHKFNGFMDYFYVGNHINNVGLNDLYGKLNYTKGKFNCSSVLHVFTTSNEIQAASDPYLGTELDLSAGYKFMENVNLNIGYSQMFGGDSMVLLKGGDTSEISNWFYLMLTVKPKFLGVE